MTEAAMVPKTFVGQGRMRFVQPGGEMEPIGNRIITVPRGSDESQAPRSASRRRFIAYVPVGSVAKGKALVETGGAGKTIACSICHGDALKGLGNVPRLAGLHPIYIARQLYLFKDGTRNGVDAQLMKKPAAKLTEDDILAMSAYLGIARSVASPNDQPQRTPWTRRSLDCRKRTAFCVHLVPRVIARQADPQQLRRVAAENRFLVGVRQERRIQDQVDRRPAS